MEIDERKYGYVYRITNLINDKTYIGQHKVVKDEKWLTYMGSGRLIRYAIHKYGKDNFSKELVCYANSKPELDNLEKYLIEKELVNERSEYNIYGSDAKFAIKLDELNLNDEDLLKWYFDDKMSYNDIALKLNCSIPTVYNYMKELRAIDKRFKDIKQGDNRGKNIYDIETLKLNSIRSHQKVVCENCNRKISYINHKLHLEACLSDDYYNGFRKHKCANAECSVMIYKKNTYCKEHFTLNGFQGVSTPDSVKKGGIVASHNRWHVKRNKVSATCELCQKDKVK